jgi:hypothetical protein
MPCLGNMSQLSFYDLDIFEPDEVKGLTLNFHKYRLHSESVVQVEIF